MGPGVTDAEPRRRRIRYLLAAGRTALGLLLLAWVLSRVNWVDREIVDPDGAVAVSPGVLSSIAGAHPVMLLASVFLMIAAMVAAAFRWRMLLAAQDVIIGPGRIVKLAFLAEFFSTLMPGRLGGDAVKAYCVAKESSRTAGVLVSVAVDRIAGLFGLACLSALMLAVLWLSDTAGSRVVRAPFMSVCVVVGAAIALGVLLSPRLRRLFRVSRLLEHVPFAEALSAAFAAVDEYRGRPRLLVRTMGLTVLAHILDVMAVATIGSSLALDIAWYDYLLYVPLILIITALPITPGAIGVMEELFVLYLGVANNIGGAFALAVLVRLATVLCALPGALFLDPRYPGSGSPRNRCPRGVRGTGWSCTR